MTKVVRFGSIVAAVLAWMQTLLCGNTGVTTLAFSSPLSTPSSTGNGLLIIGYGNVGKSVAREAGDPTHFDWIRGTSRSANDNDGVVVPFQQCREYLTAATHVIVTIQASAVASPDDTNDGVHHDTNDDKDPNRGHDTTMRMVSENASRLSWLGIVSTTGVYGNHDGAWVTEQSDLLAPPDSSSQRYIRYEQQWTSIAERLDCDLCIFRCAGLYGPSRSALHTLWKKGRPSTVGTNRTDGITNRIHEQDVGRAVCAAMQQSTAGIVNLADDLPEKRSVVTSYASSLLESIGVEPPPAVTTLTEASKNGRPPSSSRSRRRGMEAKLVSNRRMKDMLLRDEQRDGLQFPTYREGLQSILQDRSQPWWRQNDTDIQTVREA